MTENTGSDFRGGDDRKNFKRGGGRKKRISFKKKRPPADLRFDYKQVQDLLPFLTEEGKIIPARVSGLRASQQRELTTAVKRARNIGFLSSVRRLAVSA